tara:strand:- start:37249 stop:37536 length:288 start_codon:yes stop_codon:yes gene_type:complete
VIYSLEPVNRYLLIQEIEKVEEEKSSAVLLPDGLMTQKPVHEYYEVLNKAGDCNIDVESGDFVVVSNNMVERFKFKEAEQLMILENYVLAVVRMN